MKKSRFTESQIVMILKEYESGVSAQDISRKYGVSKAAFYKWRSRYGGMDTIHLKRLKELEGENYRLKRMYADLSLDHQLLKEVLEKKL